MKTQAWGWLIAGIMALGLNGFYQDGGFEWAHRAVNEVENSTGAVLALASGHAEQFLAEAQLLKAASENPSCPLERQLAHVRAWVAQTAAQTQTQIEAQTQVQADQQVARLEVMSARHQAELARFQADRDRIAAQVEAQRARWEAAADRFNRGNLNRVHFESVEINPADFTNCGAIKVQIPHVHVRVPKLPRVHVQVPSVHVEVDAPGAGPV
jgi:hypothetical protein